MTGVRYGLLDLDWLLAALRLYLPPGDTAAALAVDGEKGLTAVEGFFLNRLYMYRQVYLHKAVRAADAVSRALFARLRVLGPQSGTPPALEALLRGEQVSTDAFLQLDDASLQAAIRRYAQGDDAILRELAMRQRDRRLFKSMRLHPDAPMQQVEARLHEILRQGGHDPVYAGGIDRVEIDPYIEDEALMVISSRGRLQRLLDASPVMRGLARETFVHYRVLFPGELRDQVASALSDLR